MARPQLTGPPDCSKYEVSLGQVRQLTAADRAVRDLHRYLTSFGGAKFDQLADRRNPDEFTSADFCAVGKLKVSVLLTARQSLLGEARPEVRRLLGAIPGDLDIWDVEPEDYDSRLGPGSPAWQLWRLVYDKQAGARRAGRGVTAGKLLHAKRPRLIPIYDHGHFWIGIWCALRDSEVRSHLRDIQASVDQAVDLSLLRVLDIITWMSQEPHLPAE
jgi:uncharacterized protein DUF6308